MEHMQDAYRILRQWQGAVGVFVFKDASTTSPLARFFAICVASSQQHTILQLA